MRQKRRWLAILLALLALTVAVVADARVGGGHSYSGGRGGGGFSRGGGFSSSRSYSGGSGGSGDLSAIFDLLFHIVRALVHLTIHKPIIGIPLDLLIIYSIYYFLTREREFISSGVGLHSTIPRGFGFGRLNVSQRLKTIQADIDPDFSRALFSDYCYALFAEVHKARGAQKIKELSSFLAYNVMNGLDSLSQGVRAVNGIVVGSSTINQVTIDDKQVRITLQFEANYTETLPNGQTQSWYAVENWGFVRAREVKSKPPETIRQIVCPSCGAAPANDGQNRCPSCGSSNAQGRLAWFVEAWSQSREQRPPLLTSDVAEVGTDLPTLYDPDLKQAQAALFASEPGFQWPPFTERVKTIFLQLQAAWTERKWERARPFETDAMFQTHSYWMAEYKKQKLVNMIKDVQVGGIIPVKVVHDKYYSSITVRIFANMKDYTVKEGSQELVSGNPKRTRAFTEYWTFIKGRGAFKESTKGDLFCPACGAGLKISMAGHCEFCKAKITSGEFDWILSTIEQDEAYVG